MSRNRRCVGVATHGGTDRSSTSDAFAEGGGQDAVRSDAAWWDAPAGGVDLLLEGGGRSIGLAVSAAGGGHLRGLENEANLQVSEASRTYVPTAYVKENFISVASR